MPYRYVVQQEVHLSGYRTSDHSLFLRTAAGGLCRWVGVNTTFGALRAADGHAEPYRVKWFELGNEEYNPHFALQVAAMEAKAASLGMPKTLYLFPGGGPKPADAENLSALGLGDHLVSDTHGQASGATKLAAPLLDATNGTMVGWGAINLGYCQDGLLAGYWQDATQDGLLAGLPGLPVAAGATSVVVDESG